jgi:hypothetical protein
VGCSKLLIVFDETSFGPDCIDISLSVFSPFSEFISFFVLADFNEFEVNFFVSVFMEFCQFDVMMSELVTVVNFDLVARVDSSVGA